VKEVYLLYTSIFVTATVTRWNFNGVYSSTLVCLEIQFTRHDRHQEPANNCYTLPQNLLSWISPFVRIRNVGNNAREAHKSANSHYTLNTKHVEKYTRYQWENTYSKYFCHCSRGVRMFVQCAAIILVGEGDSVSPHGRQLNKCWVRGLQSHIYCQAAVPLLKIFSML
jgi:hypothetical protein